MTTSRLKLYNASLRILGERKLASLSENREPRRLLDEIWDDDAVRYVLSKGLWNFATRTREVEYSPSVEPDFGYAYAFDKPDDWIRTVGVASDGYFNCPLTQYADEQGYWFADVNPLYVRYVSDDASYGSDYSLWPPNFAHWVEHWLAEQACERITQSATKKAAIEKKAKRLLIEARSIDAMNEPTSFPPRGSWSRARGGGRAGDRTGSQLIG